MNLDYEKENKLSGSMRQTLSMPNRVTKQDQSHFLRLFTGNEQRALRNNLNAAEIATGYIPYVHCSNLITGVAPNLKNRLVSKIAGRVFIEGEDEKLKEIKTKFKESYLTKVLKKAFDNSLTTGRNTMVVDFNAEYEKVKIRNFDLFRTKLYYNAFDELIQADLFLNDFSINIMEYYIVIERRYYNNELKPCQKIVVTKMSWSDEKKDITKIEEYEEVDKVPKRVLEQFKEIKFYHEVELENYIDLGVYPIDNTVSNSKYPYSNIPESQFLDVQDLIVELDITRTNKSVDQELGRGRALVPEFMKTGNDFGSFSNHNIATHMTGSMNIGMPKDAIITRYPSMSIDDNKPTSIQFDLRTEQWRTDIEGTIGDICSAVGMTVLDYDPRFLQMGQRTDDEINAMTDITRGTVIDKREIAEESINSMLELISKLYGLSTPMFIRWSMRSILNPSKNTTLITQQLANGTISQLTAIKRENPDFTDAEVLEELEKIKAETEAKPSMDFEF